MASEIRSCCNTVMNYLSWGKNKGVDLYHRAAAPGETHKKVLTFVRTSVGIASIYCCPLYAGGAAIVCSIAPNKISAVTTKMEGMITGLWNSMSFNQRVLAAGAGITISVAGYGLLNIPAAILSAKLGGELAIRNYAKQNVAEAAAKAEKEHTDILEIKGTE
jgi:hypothetical protein